MNTIKPTLDQLFLDDFFLPQHILLVDYLNNCGLMSISHSGTMLNGESLRIPADDKFSLFEVTTHTYKTVLGHPILVDIHVPKRLLSEIGGVQGLRKRPVLIRIHGGWLVRLIYCPHYGYVRTW